MGHMDEWPSLNLTQGGVGWIKFLSLSGPCWDNKINQQETNKKFVIFYCYFPTMPANGHSRWVRFAVITQILPSSPQKSGSSGSGEFPQVTVPYGTFPFSYSIHSANLGHYLTFTYTTVIVIKSPHPHNLPIYSKFLSYSLHLSAPGKIILSHRRKLPMPGVGQAYQILQILQIAYGYQ